MLIIMLFNMFRNFNFYENKGKLYTNNKRKTSVREWKWT